MSGNTSSCAGNGVWLWSRCLDAHAREQHLAVTIDQCADQAQARVVPLAWKTPYLLTLKRRMLRSGISAPGQPLQTCASTSQARVQDAQLPDGLGDDMAPLGWRDRRTCMSHATARSGRVRVRNCLGAPQTCRRPSTVHRASPQSTSASSHRLAPCTQGASHRESKGNAGTGDASAEWRRRTHGHGGSCKSSFVFAPSRMAAVATMPDLQAAASESARHAVPCSGRLQVHHSLCRQDGALTQGVNHCGMRRQAHPGNVASTTRDSGR